MSGCSGGDAVINVGAFTWSRIAVPRGLLAGTVRAGVDRIELSEFQHTLSVAGPRFIENTLTLKEIDFCAGRVNRLATRFAAKEAVAKVLGTGFRNLGWQEIEVLTAPQGEPRLVLHGRARERADQLGVTSIGVSLTHTGLVAEAFVVALCTDVAKEQFQEEAESGGRK
jgi:holo-[acyl-carrier protein] synthase